MARQSSPAIGPPIASRESHASARSSPRMDACSSQATGGFTHSYPEGVAEITRVLAGALSKGRLRSPALLTGVEPAFAHVLDFFADELSRLSRGRLALSVVLACPFQHLVGWHTSRRMVHEAERIE